MTLEEKIKAIPGEDGWWKQSAFDGFLEVANRLIKHGIEEKEVVLMLEYLYWQTASCYGD